MQHQAARTKIHDVTEGLRTDKTREEYCRAFNAFYRYTNLTSKEELLKQDPHDIEEFIIEYLTEYLLKQRHLKYSSITLHKAQFDLK